MKAHRVTVVVVEKVARLAKLVIDAKQKTKFAAQLSSVLDYISKIQMLDTKNVEETSQVTGMTNVFREDVIDTSRILTQKQALSNAKKTHRGYFVVPAIFDQ